MHPVRLYITPERTYKSPCFMEAICFVMLRYNKMATPQQPVSARLKHPPGHTLTGRFAGLKKTLQEWQQAVPGVFETHQMQAFFFKNSGMPLRRS